MLSIKHLTLPSNLEDALMQFDPFFDRICDNYNINNSYYSTMKVTLIEAIKNAVNHGNKENKYKYVQVDVEQSNSGLTFSVTDEGQGFNPENIQLDSDHTATGLFLIRKLSDKISWEKEGRCLKITFFVTTINYDHAVLRQEILQNYFLEITEKSEQSLANKNVKNIHKEE